MRALPLILASLVLVPLGLLPAPASAAAPPAPVVLATTATIGPPSVLPDEECNEANIACGLFDVQVTFGRIDALPVGEFSADLRGAVHTTRTFGCVASDGSRLRGHDVVVESDDTMATRRAMPLSRDPGQQTLTGYALDLYRDGPALAACPAGSSAALLAIRMSALTLTLSLFGDGAPSWTYPVPGRWGWAGVVTAQEPAAIAAGPLLLNGTQLTVVPPEKSGAAATCPASNGCCRLELTGVPFRPGDRSSLIRGALKATGTLERRYGCVTAGGRRLHRYDTRAVEPAAFNGGPGKVFTLIAGNDSTRVTLVAQLTDRQPGDCPTGAHAVLFRISVRDLAITLVAFTNPEARTTVPIPERRSWAGAVATGD